MLVERMALKTTAFDRAEAMGWDVAELAKRSGLSLASLYKLKDGSRSPGPKAIEGLLSAFPNLSYRDLFVPDNRTQVRRPGTSMQPEPEPTAA
jgi:transcriptional regulator with XRE-family HTH domain